MSEPVKKTDTTTVGYWDRKRASLAPVAVGALGLLGLGLWTGFPLRESIEKDLQHRSQQALATSGYSNLTVSFTGNGRDGVVTGALPSGKSADDALAVVKGVEGVRTATYKGATNPSTVPAPSPSNSAQAVLTAPAVTAAAKDGAITLTGRVPSQAQVTALNEAAISTFGAGNVDNQLTVDAGVNDNGLNELAGVIKALGKDSAATATWDKGTLTLSGTVSADTKSALEQSAKNLASKAQQFNNTLSVGNTNAPSTSPSTPTGSVQDQLNTLPQVLFNTGSAQLTRAGEQSVRQAADILKNNPDAKVQVQGHTDSVGSEGLNDKLSAKRAETVKSLLVSLGVPADRLSTRGFGSSQPKVPNTSADNRAANRRVQFVVTP